ncbi:two-component system, NarL family, sensor histidine kinase UhpB [Anaerolineales bacterium]|jgi:signal transduction histidine kinase|nr:two-component system, NarL family, sensor histidine kinase UhpB [Anaerolineales bacterium]
MKTNRAALPTFVHSLWMRIISAPAAVKLVGLAVLPVATIIISAWLYAEIFIFRPLAASPDITLNAQTLFDLSWRAFLWLGLGALIGIGASVTLTWVLIRQLGGLVKTMGRVETGDMTVRSPVWSQDEIGQVQAAFNTMINSLQQSRDDLMKNQRELESLDNENTRLIEELREKETELRFALRRAVDVQEQERKRIARELHDEIGQALTSILIRLKSLQNITDLDVMTDRLDGIRYLASQTIEEMRRLSMDLRPAALDNLGILPALRWHIGQSMEQNQIEIQFTAPERMERLPPEVEIVLYRVAQEGLNNAIRHSQAKHVEVKLEHTPLFVWLSVSDDGQGFDADGLHRGLGLVGIRERVDLLKGQCGIESQRGSGARLWVEIPLTEANPAHA